MSGNKLLESLKIKECDRFPSRVSGHCNWDSIRLIKSHLTQKQLELFKATCFGHFLDVSDMVLSGQFCHHILLRECHVKNADDNASSLWYHVGNGLIRFSPVEFYLVSGLAFAENSESTLELFKQKNSRLRRIYFQGSKVNVKMIVDWFRNLGPNNKISDDDVVKLALILFLEMTLVGKDDRTTILYWALVLVDDLEAFNQFPWGSFIYGRTFNSLSTCLHGRDDKFKIKSTDDKLEENVDGPVRRKGERYNVYGFLTAFQVMHVNLWLEGDHIETYCRLMRQRAYYNPQLYKQNIVLLDYTFMIKIEGRWATATATKGKKQKQFNHETYQWDNTMTDYVTGKYSWITSEYWQTVNTILFPANVNKNHWVAVEVDLNERVIKIYDSKPDAYSVDQILKWATCLRKMFPSLLVHVMPTIYTDPSSFTVERPVEGIPHQGNQSDCGVFTLKFLEYLWAKKQFDFDEKDGESFRVKIATEIFQNSKEVPYVNDE